MPILILSDRFFLPGLFLRELPSDILAQICQYHTVQDNIFFPNVRDFLKILAVLPMGSTEAKRSFSCIRRILTCLRNTMTTERLSDLAVIAVHANVVIIDRSVVCEKFVALHPRRMTASTLLAD